KLGDIKPSCLSRLSGWSDYLAKERKKCLPYWVMLSGFIWTLITAFYVTYLVAMGQNLWFIYLAALPVQIIVILFARLQ
ncbi:MAG: hypothetical protein K5694_03000, partial [Bacilli bacterium]|nr:hypothetical protein [Bacilli bacterium]